MNYRIVAIALALAVMAMPAHAAEKTDKPDSAPVTAKERTVVTHHTAEINGRTIRYTATAGTQFLKDDKDKPIASLFYVAYTRDGVRHPEKRPIIYIFNGGPGSSSVWLHLGAFGPRKVVFDDAEQPAPAPYTITDNADSLLDVADLVFIDPVGTGYSRTLGDAKAKQFLGVKQDLKSVGEFIRLYATRHERWNSPKYLAGESYGTTRAAALVNYLQNNDGMYFNGVVLISSILNFQTADFGTGNDLPYITFLPTYAATAWYHKALKNRPDDLEAFLKDARHFAETEYASALMKGARLTDAERHKVAEDMATYTGLDAGFIEESNLRVNIFRFTKELLRDRRRTVGRLDSRYTGIDHDAAGETFEHDPSYTAILGPYTAALNTYMRDELGFDEDREYEILSGKVNQQWDWDTGDEGYLNVADDLREAMSKNTHLKLYVGAGYYDLATPFFAAEYTMDHLGLEPELQPHVQIHYFKAGHMVYVHPDSLDKLSKSLRGFVEKTDQE